LQVGDVGLDDERVVGCRCDIRDRQIATDQRDKRVGWTENDVVTVAASPKNGT
jgi:hypothetical protein